MEQTQDAKKLFADQTATEQDDKALNEAAQNKEETFWFSWYSAIMLLSSGFFLYYFPRLIGFPDAAYHITDFTAGIIDSVGFLLALILLFMTFEKVIGDTITLGMFSFLCSIPIIIVLRLATTKHNQYTEFARIFLVIFQILDLLIGMLMIYAVFYTLYLTKPTRESLRAFLRIVTVSKVFTFLLALLGAITVIVPFIQFMLSFILNRH